jgi:hypothetical protein
MQVDTAIALWQLLLNDKCNFLGAWIDFMQNDKKELQVI